MKLLFHISILLTLAAFTTGCSTSKSFAKKGLKLEEAGMLEEAAQMYVVSLQKNRANIDAQIGLKKAGQAVLNRELQEFVQAKTMGTKRDAINSFHEAERYQTLARNLGVALNIPEFYLQDYNAVKEEHIAELYDEGITYMDAGQFNEAEERFNEIAKLDPEHKEATDLAAIAYCEPLYVQAQEAIDIEHYREAYNALDKVMRRTPSYKDAADLKKEVLADGLFTVAMLPFENATIRSGLDAKVEAYALEALTSVDDPFLKVVDRKNIELILEEQKLGLSGVIDEETAVSVGDLIGAKAIVTGTVLSYNKVEGDPIAATRDAYEQYKVKRKNEEDGKFYYETKYRKTTYRELTRQNSVTVSFQYKLISLATGEILKSSIVERSSQDAATWAEYDGNLELLYPARNNGVSLNSRARRNLVSMMSANRNPRGVDQLTNDAFQSIINEMKGDIRGLMQELVK